MTQKTLGEKDMFLQNFQRESQITLKVLKSFPEEKSDLKPSPKSRNARELAWAFVAEQAVTDMALKGNIDFSTPGPQPPGTLKEVISTFERTARETADKISRAGENDLNKMVKFPIGPGKMGDFRVIDVLNFVLMDQVHHRGQFSVYLRIAGGRVPSIYGPTADETWM
jgi:uncharacterized damage-inducible protein DinB